MTTRFERFLLWRKENFINEMDCFYTSEMMYQYLQSALSFKDIDDNFDNLFIEFDQHKVRTRGCIVLLKFALEEYVQALPAHDATAVHLVLLKALTELCTLFYEAPVLGFRRMGNEFFPEIAQLLNVPDEVFFTPARKEARFLLLALYLSIKHIAPTVDTLGWLAAAPMQLFLTKESLKEYAQTLLSSILGKAKFLNTMAGELTHSERLAAAQKQINARYLHVFKDNHVTEECIKSLDVHSTAVLAEMNMLREYLNKKKTVEANIDAIIALLNAAQLNERNVYDRQYFLDFIANNEVHYKIFVACMHDTAPEFFDKVAQLQRAVDEGWYGVRIAHGISTMTRTALEFYRYKTPALVQNYVRRGAALVPGLATLDSECKTLFIAHALKCLRILGTQINILDQDVAKATEKLFGAHDPLALKTTSDSLTVLDELTAQNQAAKDVLEKYRDVFAIISKNNDFLCRYTLVSEDLTKYVQTHTTFWVRVSNFLAQFFSLFKTTSACFLDQINEHKQQLDNLLDEYRQAIAQDFDTLRADSSLSESVKTELEANFNQQESSKSQIIVQNRVRSASKIDVQLLITQLSSLFAAKPAPSSYEEKSGASCTP